MEIVENIVKMTGGVTVAIKSGTGALNDTGPGVPIDTENVVVIDVGIVGVMVRTRLPTLELERVVLLSTELGDRVVVIETVAGAGVAIDGQ